MSAHDTGLALADGLYFHTTGAHTWNPARRGELEAMLRGDNPPEFRTVLAIQGDPDFDRMTHDEIRKVRYSGPAYFDLDGETVGDAIGNFKDLLGKLRGLDLDLGSVRMYATGGRGFHLEIPGACFAPGGLPVEGVTALPGIFREMAHALYVECMDLRVYSSKRGRMWRVPNRQRENGLFKVAITADEALSVTPERYGDLCSAPRDFPVLAAPKFCPGLGMLYAKGRDKVSAPRKSRKVPEKLRAELQKRFAARGLPLPPSLLALLAGKVQAREGAGWNQICVQLAIAAHAMSLSEAELLKLASPLLDHHDGDSRRYGSRWLRERELTNKYAYFVGCGLYDFSSAGIKSILPRDMPCNDLEGL
jgi:hypothetical protein